MGTTLTAVYVGEEEVAIAHVGDSRAYCLRDGQLLRLTDDHSLVDELMRQGRLTPEEAVEHPQRSVITRALGPEGMVEVDTRSVRARAGDVYLLCSDGLTTMIAEEQIDGGAARPPAPARRRRGADRGGQRGGRTRQHHRGAAAPGGRAGRPGARPLDEHATMVGLPVVPAAVPPRRADARHRPSQRSRRRPRRLARGVLRASPRLRAGTGARAGGCATRGALAFLLTVLVVIGSGAYLAFQSVYFIGTNNRGLVTMFEGLPYRLPGNLTLYSSQYVSGVSASTLSSRTTAHAARPLAALGSQRRVADPQPRTGTARMRRAR